MREREALKLALEALETVAVDVKTTPTAYEVQRQAITAIHKVLAQPEQDDGMCQACEANQCTAKQGCVALDNPSQPEPDWKRLVLAHNAECEERCNKEHCGYARYFEANGRRCPTCPVYEKIDVDTTPPQRKPLTDEQCINQMLSSGFERNSLGWSFTYGRLDYHLLKFARAIEAAHGIKE